MKNFLVLGLSFLFLCSCESRDGIWDPMKWTVNPSDINKDRVIVPSSGGTYIFTCKNYANICVTDVYENGEYIYVCDQFWERNWYSVTIDENIVTVVISSNDTFSIKNLKVCLIAAGGAYDSFLFEQSSIEE